MDEVAAAPVELDPDRAALLREFSDPFPFGLDPFQVEACTALLRGEGVLVAAPTGSGKTVVGELAAFLALKEGHRCFYTTPIKALSNQKHRDLTNRFGKGRVGLLTGDTSVDPDAPVVVMTTEVLRNMIYSRSRALDGLGYVVMDEVHYLADRSRGAVWEEVLVHLPDPVRVVSLSATVSNAEEFGEWLGTVRGPTRVVVEERRPVPLKQHVLVGDDLRDLYVPGTSDVEPSLLRLAAEEERSCGLRGLRYAPVPLVSPPARSEVPLVLEGAGLLPAIVFVFSRAGCDSAVRSCLYDQVRLTSEAERLEIRRHVEERTSSLPDGDLAALDYPTWLEGLERGVAAHHAGMLPLFKEVVEELFTRALLKVVYATETLALGINMPARTVVLERLSKWNGDGHADLTAGEYTQLTGRAGRRGIDTVGHAVVVWQRGLDPLRLSTLASKRTYPLRSSFRPSYNMAANLVQNVGRERARELLGASFAQFQADRSVVPLAKRALRLERSVEDARSGATCERGDVSEYASLAASLSRLERDRSAASDAARRAEVLASLSRLVAGDVLAVPNGRRTRLVVVVDADQGSVEPRPVVVAEDGWNGRLSAAGLDVPVEPLDRLRLGRRVDHRSANVRRELSRSLKQLGLRPEPPSRRRTREDRELDELRDQVASHPVGRCPDVRAHLAAAAKVARLEGDLARVRADVESRTGTVAATFDRVCSVLEDLGHLDGDAVTSRGRLLAGVYSSADLLVVECLVRGLWDGLAPPHLAAAVSSLVFESRTDVEYAPVPKGRSRNVLFEMEDLWEELSAKEGRHSLSELRGVDPGFAAAAQGWASGQSLSRVLSESDLSAGDFVRWTKQLVDLLRQVAKVAGDTPVGAAARAAASSLERGVVAYSSSA